jgi:multiple sugar transport system substrate-binding protein
MSYLEKNKKINRREFLRVSALGATGALLAACGGAATPAPEIIEKEVVVTKEVEKIVEVTSAAPAAAGVTVLSFGHHWEAAFQPVQEGWDNQFMEQHPEIVIKRTYNSWADHNTIVPTWAAAGTLPDIIYVHGSRSFPWAHEGIIVSVQEYIDSDKEFNIEGIWEEALRLYRYEGKQVSIPYDHGPLLMGYNKDIFDAAGQPYPAEDWTMEDFFETAKALTNKDNQLWGFGDRLPLLGPGEGGATLRPWGAALMNEDQTALTLDTPEAKEAIQWWADLIFEHGVALSLEESAGITTILEGGGGPFRSGVVAMDLVASWDTPSLAAFSTFNWDIAPWPAGPKGQGTGSFGSGFSITGDSKNPDAGWAYLREYLSTEGMIALWGSTGRGSPARKDAYDSWLQSEIAPEHGQYYLEALENYAKTDPPYATLAAAEILDIVGRETGLIKSGDKTVDEAVATIMEEGTAAIAKVS